MVICKFFQQGNCRYGQGCRFDHIYGSKYNYSAPRGSPPEDQIIKQVQTDVQASLKGGHWILSSYAPFSGKAPFPGFLDLSPEEARLFIYEAKVNNNIDEAVVYINSLIQDAKSKFQQIVQPSPAVINTIKNLYNGEHPPSPFTKATTNQTSASSVFRSAAQSAGAIIGQTTPSIFGPQTQSSSPSIFTQQTNNSGAKSVFANQSIFANQNTIQPNNTAGNIFASATKQFFGPSQTENVFQQNTSPFTTPQSGFPSNTVNIFQKSESHNQNVFAQNTNTFKTANVNNNICGQSNPTNIFADKSNIYEENFAHTNIYSKLEELSQKHLEAFQSDKFILGFIPEVPPPHSLCVK